MQSNALTDSGVLVLDYNGFLTPSEFDSKEKISPTPRIKTIRQGPSGNNDKVTSQEAKLKPSPFGMGRCDKELKTEENQETDVMPSLPPLQSEESEKSNESEQQRRKTSGSHSRRTKTKHPETKPKPTREPCLERAASSFTPEEDTRSIALSIPAVSTVVEEMIATRDKYWQEKVEQLEIKHISLMKKATEEMKFMADLFDRKEQAFTDFEEECLAAYEELDDLRSYCCHIENERDSLQQTLALREVDYERVQTELDRHRLALHRLEEYHKQTPETYPSQESLRTSLVSSLKPQSTDSSSTFSSDLSSSLRDLRDRVRKDTILATSGRLLRTARESNSKRGSRRRQLRLTHSSGLDTAVAVCSVKSSLTSDKST